MSLPTAALQAADMGINAGGRRRINLIGGSAYSSTGGVQAVNRRLVHELDTAGLLRSAHFLWDGEATVSDSGRALAEKGAGTFYSRNRKRMLGHVLRQAWRSSRELWFCTHINYSPLGLLASGGQTRQFGVMLHAAELDGQLSASKRFAVRRAGFVIAVSEYTKRKAINLGVRESRIHVVPHGVDDPRASSRTAEVKRDAQRILFVGRMDEHYKGQLELLEALALLRRRFPPLRLVFVGGGQTLNYWQKQAAHLGVGDIVEFTGEISEKHLEIEYETATLFAMPSENEGFGLVFAEAMAHGLPCIGSDRDAAREIISEGETGFCVPARNATALADAIGGLLKSPELRARMAQGGRERFLACYSAEKYRDRLLTAIAEWSASG